METAANRKKDLRTGYTTGACAAAAAKAAAISLSAQREVSQVEISLPGGGTAGFQVESCVFGPAEARCSVIKDAGDDPDVTHGGRICATVRWVEQSGIAIGRGEGVGLVTRPGLGLEIGSPAINPVPKMMIASSVEEVLGLDPSGPGVEVVISVPGGAELAKRTLNERLGIVGGLSILGTSGIVRPFSTSAYQACIAQALNVAVASGLVRVVLTTGGRTEKYARAVRPLPEEAFIQMGDFVGFALGQCAAKGIPDVAIVAMIGKMSKIAAGVFQTHASHSRVDTGFLAEIARSCGLPPDMVSRTRESNTARHFYEILPEPEAGRVFSRLCEVAAGRCRQHTRGRLNVECILVAFDGQVLGRALADA